MTDDATINNTQKLLCQSGDVKWLPHYRISLCLRFEPNHVINSRTTALKSNGRKAGCYTQIRGWVFLAAVPGKVLKLMIIISRCS